MPLLNPLTRQSASNPLVQERDATIAQDRVLTGASCAKLAKKFGYNKTTIARILKKPEPRRILELGTQAKIMMVPRATDELWAFLTGEDPKLRFKAIERILDDSGIGDAHTVPSNLNMYVYNDNRGQGDNWKDMEEYGQFLTWKRDQDIEDAEIVEEEGHNEGDIEGPVPGKAG